MEQQSRQAAFESLRDHVSRRHPPYAPKTPRCGKTSASWLLSANLTLLLLAVAFELAYFLTGGNSQNGKLVHPNSVLNSLGGVAILGVLCIASSVVTIPLALNAARKEWGWRYGEIIPAMVLPTSESDSASLLNAVLFFGLHIALGPLAMIAQIGPLGRIGLLYVRNGQIRKTSLLAYADSQGVLPVDDWEVVWMIRPTWLWGAQVIRAIPPHTGNYIEMPQEVAKATLSAIGEAEKDRALATGAKPTISLIARRERALNPPDTTPSTIRLPVKRKSELRRVMNPRKP